MYSNIKKNLLLNYSGAFVSALIPLVVIPLYLKSFGAVGWGLVSFVMVIQSVASLLEAGLSQSLVREFTHRRVEKNKLSSILFLEFEIIYLFFSLSLMVLIFFSAKFIVLNWLNVPSSQESLAVDVVSYSSIFIACQIHGSIYRSVLISKDSHADINVLNSVFLILKHLFGVLLAVTTRNIFYLIVWFSLIASIELIFKRFYAKLTFEFDYSDLRYIWFFDEAKKVIPFALKMSIATVIGAFAVQFDKLLVSKMLPIDEFSIFSIASMLSLGLMQFTQPLTTSLLPVLIALKTNKKLLVQVNIKTIKMLVYILSIIWVLFFLLGGNVLYFWLQNDYVANKVVSLFSWLLLGTTMNVIYSVLLNNILALGLTRHILILNCMGLLTVMVVLPISVHLYGLSGAVSGWVSFNVVALIYSILLVYSKYKKMQST